MVCIVDFFSLNGDITKLSVIWLYYKGSKTSLSDQNSTKANLNIQLLRPINNCMNDHLTVLGRVHWIHP